MPDLGYEIPDSSEPGNGSRMIRLSLARANSSFSLKIYPTTINFEAGIDRDRERSITIITSAGRWKSDSRGDCWKLLGTPCIKYGIFVIWQATMNLYCIYLSSIIPTIAGIHAGGLNSESV